jgi:hypothetical protein
MGKRKDVVLPRLRDGERETVIARSGEHVVLGTVIEDFFGVGPVRVRVQIVFDDARKGGPPVFPVLTPAECRALVGGLDKLRAVLTEAADAGQVLGSDGEHWLMFDPAATDPAAAMKKKGAH